MTAGDQSTEFRWPHVKGVAASRIIVPAEVPQDLADPVGGDQRTGFPVVELSQVSRRYGVSTRGEWLRARASLTHVRGLRAGAACSAYPTVREAPVFTERMLGVH